MYYSERYWEEVELLRDSLKARMKGLELPRISAADRAVGVDALPEDLKLLCTDEGRMRRAGGYDLSYNQMCQGFFGAYDELNEVRDGTP